MTGRSDHPGGRRRRPVAPLIASLLCGLLASCAPLGAGETSSAGDVITIGAYSVVREVFHEGLIPAFQAAWKEKTGRTVKFEESYNASGAQARAIAAGFDADIAVLSLESDMDLLVKAGLVPKAWNKGPGGGMLTHSLVVIGVRPGNPKSIHDWSGLARAGVGVLYPDPKTSGGARWNIMAVYGAGLYGPGGPKSKPDPDAARELLARVQKNVVNMDSSGRQSLATFERGIGDAVVTYENELILRKEAIGSDIATVLPPVTLQIESPVALLEPSLRRHGNKDVAEAFLAFLRSGSGQTILAKYGFRPTDNALDNKLGFQPRPAGLFTIRDPGLDGWSKVKAKVFDSGGVWASIFTSKDQAASKGGASKDGKK